MSNKSELYTRGVLRAKKVLTDALSLGGTALSFTAAQFNQVLAAFGTVTFDRGVKVAKVALGHADTGGGIFAWANPEAGTILIPRVIINVTTIATSACSISVGTTASSATTSSANLIDTLDVHSATGTFDNITDASTNGKARQRLAAGKWVTASVASGASAGLVGSLYIEYIVT